jgi:hypothetical protein
MAKGVRSACEQGVVEPKAEKNPISREDPELMEGQVSCHNLDLLVELGLGDGKDARDVGVGLDPSKRSEPGIGGDGVLGNGCRTRHGIEDLRAGEEGDAEVWEHMVEDWPSRLPHLEAPKKVLEAGVFRLPLNESCKLGVPVVLEHCFIESRVSLELRIENSMDVLVNKSSRCQEGWGGDK